MADEAGGFTQEQLDAAVKEALAKQKGEHDEAFQNLWSEAKATKRVLQDLGGADKVKADLAELAEIRDELAKIEQEDKAEKAGLTKEKLDEIRGQIKAEMEQRYTPLSEENDRLTRKVRELTLDNVVKAQMVEHGVLPNRAAKFFQVHADKFDLTDDLEPVVKGNEGRDIGKFIEEDLAKDWPEFYAGTGSSGGGASRSTAGSGFTRSIAADDRGAFMANLESIAKGETKVVE